MPLLGLNAAMISSNMVLKCIALRDYSQELGNVFKLLSQCQDSPCRASLYMLKELGHNQVTRLKLIGSM